MNSRQKELKEKALQQYPALKKPVFLYSTKTGELDSSYKSGWDCKTALKMWTAPEILDRLDTIDDVRKTNDVLDFDRYFLRTAEYCQNGAKKLDLGYLLQNKREKHQKGYYNKADEAEKELQRIRVKAGFAA